MKIISMQEENNSYINISKINYCVNQKLNLVFRSFHADALDITLCNLNETD